MTPERLERIQRLFNEASALSGSQRSAFLIEACGSDLDLLAEVESLLTQSNSDGTAIGGVRIRNSQIPTKILPLARTQKPRFPVGQVLADRYEILRFIGLGGMGEVYEAKDRDLHERVALKTIRPDIATEQLVLERFKREIQLARKVTHPNVCRIFDLARHVAPVQTESGSIENVTAFLTMELLEGETLAQRLRRAGRITSAEALPLAAQMASGLTAAHKAGVVHRDFKSGNIILVPSNDHEGGIRVVVTDFGLAHQSAIAEGPLVTVSQTGQILGTPGYMAPEQMRGEKVTTAADIYAFGIVLYEMITGILPFPGDSPMAMAIKRVEEPAPSPRKYVPDLDSRWETAILRCLERNPADRFPTALDVVRAIGGEHVPRAPLEKPPIRKRSRYLSAAIAAGLVLASAFGYRAYIARSTAPITGVASSVAHSVAVFDFKNKSGQQTENWLSEALARTLADELSMGNQLAIIPTRDVLQAARDLHISDAESMNAKSLRDLKRRLNVDYVVSGSYLPLGKESGGQVQVEVRLLDTSTGTTLAFINNSGTENEISKLLLRPGDRLREELGVAAVSASEASDVLASMPADPHAARLYTEGLRKLDSFDSLGAIDSLQKATAAAPKYPLIHADLAEAWSELGYDSKAREEAQKASDLSADLSPEKRSEVEARYREMTHDWDKALDIYRSLSIRFPNQPKFKLRLAAVQTAAGRAKDALITLEALRTLQSDAKPDPHIHIQEAEAYETLSDFRAEYDAAAKAADFARKVGAQLLLASARIKQCWASRNLGQLTEAVNACEEARKINESLGNRAGTARSINNIATALADQGDIAGARKLYEKALKITREIGDKYDMQGALNNIANMLFKQGDMAGAMRLYDQGLMLARERGSKVDLVTVSENIASVYHIQGNLSAAEDMYEHALSVAREVGDRAEIARVLYNLAMVLAKRGELGGAMNRYQESMAIRNQVGLKSEVAQTRLGVGDILLARGDLEGAGRSYEQALKMQTELGEKNNAAYTRLSLAEVTLQHRQLAEAETAFRQVAGDFSSQEDNDDEALAKAGLARVLLMENRLDDARNEIQQASKLGGGSSDVTVRLTISIVSARLSAALGKYAEATRSLEATQQEASRMGLVAFQFETRLALGELEMMSGKETSGRALLNELQQEAAAKEYSIIARRAMAQTRLQR